MIDPFKELKAEIKNFLIGLHADIQKVDLDVWTPEAFVISTGIKVKKMTQFLKEIENDSSGSKV